MQPSERSLPVKELMILVVVMTAAVAWVYVSFAMS